MPLELLSIFLNVIVPVFALVALGYLATPRLGLEPRTLARYAYFLLIPAFVIHQLGAARVEAGLALRMVAFMLAVQGGCALLGWGVARLLRRPARLVGAFTLVAVFGNVGNFGLPVVEFFLGAEALPAATIYFLVVNASGFGIGVGAATWHQQGGWHALRSVLRTPAILALFPALLLSATGTTLPLVVARPLALLSGATVPTMLVALGAQLAVTRRFTIDRDVLAASAVRLVGGPLLAALLVVPFALEPLARTAGIIQASMPAAVLTSIIAMEHDLAPEFVTAVVLLSTTASLVTLTVLLALL